MVLSLFTTCAEDEGPLNRIPKLSINDIASGISSSQATLEGVISDNGSPITRCGFMVNTAKGVLEKTGIDEASVHEVTLTASGNVRLQLKDLKASTTYYYCLFVVSGNTPIKSSIGHFTTEDIAEPRFSTVEVVEVGEDFVTLRCRLIDNGGQALQTVGFDYKLQEAQSFRSVTVEDFEEGTADNSFVYTITELEPGTYYDFRASGFNGVRTGYSEIRSAQTSAKTSPTVSILDLVKENIGVNYVTVAAKIEDTGAAEITERGFLIGLVSNPVIGTEGVVNVSVFTATNDFSATLENLKPNTTYYVRAYAANNPYGSKTQYGYSPSLAFTTKSWETPTFSSITEQLEGIRLKVSCTLDNKGISIQERGFCYSSSNTTPDLTHQSVKVESEGSAIMEASFQILENTVYYVRPYVKYNLTGQEQVHYGTTYTSQRYTFVRPTFNEVVSGEVTYTTAQLSASITDNGVSVTKRGFKWGTNSVPTNDVVVSGSEFQTSLQDLKPGTTYYYRAYVEFELAGKTEQVVSTVQSFQTTGVEQPVLGDVTYSQQQSKLSLCSELTASEDVKVVESGFCWSRTTTEPDLNSQVVAATISERQLTATMAVEENVTYYIRSYVKYEVAGVNGTAFSAVQTLKTKAFIRPTLSQVSSSGVTYNAATLSAMLTTNGVHIVSKGFKWGLNSSVSNNVPVSGSEFMLSLSELTPVSKYFFKAYVIYTIDDVQHTLESDLFTFETQGSPEPVLGTLNTSLQGNQLSLSCLLNANNAEVTEVGFCWSKSYTQPTISNNTLTGSLSGSYFVASMSLDEQTTYYLRAYAKYQALGLTQVVYSEVKSIKSDALARPSITNVAVGEITYNAAKLSASIAANGATILSKGFKLGISASNMTSQVVTSDEFVHLFSNLLANTTYYYQAYVTYKVGGKEETISTTQNYFTTKSLVGSTINKPSVSNIGYREATVSSVITALGDGEVKKKGFVWSSSTSSPTLSNKTGSVELAADADFKAQLTGLSDGTNYYVRAYVINEGSGESVTSYSSYTSFTTAQLTYPTLNTPTASEITQTTIKVTSSLRSSGNSEVTEMGFCWSDQDIAPEKMTNRTKVTANNFTLTITDTVKAGNTYYIYSYATNKKGTAYSTKLKATLKYIPGQGDNPHPGNE